MKEIKIKDLENDFFKGEFTFVPIRIKIKGQSQFDTKIECYTHDEFPIKNYILVEGYKREIAFDEIEKIELINYEDR